MVFFDALYAWRGCKRKVIQIEYASSQIAAHVRLSAIERLLKTYILVTCPHSMLSTSPVGEHFAATMLNGSCCHQYRSRSSDYCVLQTAVTPYITSKSPMYMPQRSRILVTPTWSELNHVSLTHRPLRIQPVVSRFYIDPVKYLLAIAGIEVDVLAAGVEQCL